MKGRVLLAALIASALSALLVVVLVVGFLGDPTRPAPSREATLAGGWTVPTAHAGLLIEDEDGAIRTSSAVTLSRGDTTVELAAGSRVTLSEDELPELVEGEMVVETAVEVRVGDLALRPASVVRLAVTPSLIKVLAGSLALGKTLYSAGDVLVRATAGAPGAASGSSAPIVRSETESTSGATDEAPTGIVVDAADGSPLAGVQVFATWSYSDEGYPPHPDDGSQVLSSTDSAGRFTLAPFRPHDPRLALHVQLEHPQYLPVVDVLDTPRDLEGRRPPLTIRLRRAETTRVIVLDPDGRPYAGMPLEVSASGNEVPFVGEDIWDDGRSQRARRRTVRYTDNSGMLRIGIRQTGFRLLHPHLYMWSVETHDVTRSIAYPPADEPRFLWKEPFEIHTRLGEVHPYRLLDRENVPVTSSLIEIRLEDMPAMRLHTDGEGAFSFAAWPLARPQISYEGQISVRNPREGALETLAPALWKRETAVRMPSTIETITMSSRLSAHVGLRTRLIVDDGERTELSPLAPHEVRLDRDDLTLISCETSGRVVLCGVLPEPKSPLTVFVRGALPLLIETPTYLPGIDTLELGELDLRRGEGTTVRLVDTDPSLVAGARLLVSDLELEEDEVAQGGAQAIRDHHEQTYPFADASSVRVDGLVRGRQYRYAVTSPHAQDAFGEFTATAETLAEGLDVQLVSDGRTRVLARGNVLDLDPDRAHGYSVVERYWLDGQSEPVTFAPYPLSPDGAVGSERRLAGAASVDISITDDTGLSGVWIGAPREPDAPLFDVGDLSIGELRYAAFRFVTESGVNVAPPQAVALASATGDHELAKISYASELLVVGNLRPGDYTLRWKREDDSTDAHAFTIVPSRREHVEVVKRAALAEEDVIVRVVDEDGAPAPRLEFRVFRATTGAWERVEARRLAATGGANALAATGAATWAVPLRTRVENIVRILPAADAEPGASAGRRDGQLLAATVTLPPGANFPQPVVLRRSVRGEAVVLDTDQHRLDGTLSVTWRAIEEDDADPSAPPQATVVDGLPFEAGVVYGALSDDRFPPGRYRYEFRLVGAEAKAAGELTLESERKNSLGQILLRETRSLRGVVVLGDGQPAPKAIVALVDPEGAYRLPLHELSLVGQPYSARTDSLGRFEIDGLPLDMTAEMALVAHLDGWVDAVEDPVDLELPEHQLALAESTQLVIEAGYADGRDHAGFRFTLEYAFDPSAGGELFEVGVVPAQRGRGGVLFEGITPGLYRLVWDLDESHPMVRGRSREVLLLPGTAGRLSLWITERFCEGEATLNGAPLERGWVLLTTAPDSADSTTIGRVLGGRFDTPLPRRGDAALVALIPETTPVPIPNFERGELLPVPYPRYGADVADRFMRVDYRAYNVVYALVDGVAAQHPDLLAEFTHYDWSRGAFHAVKRAEPVGDGVLRLDWVQPGQLPLKFTSTGGFRFAVTLDVQDHVTFENTRGFSR